MNHETHEKHKKIMYRNESYKIQGAIFDVYKVLGSGFLEAVYQECLEKEFALRNIPFEKQVEIRLNYKDILLNQSYRADFVCYNSILIEIKAVAEITDIHRAQLINYLKATGMKLGILANFSSYPKVQIERIVL